LIENLRFFAVFYPSSLAMGVPWDIRVWRLVRKTRVTGVPDGENHKILRLLVLTQYRRVTDRQTDKQTRRL